MKKPSFRVKEQTSGGAGAAQPWPVARRTGFHTAAVPNRPFMRGVAAGRSAERSGAATGGGGAQPPPTQTLRGAASTEPSVTWIRAAGGLTIYQGVDESAPF